MFRRFCALFLAGVFLCSISAAAAVGSRYSDVPPNDWSVSAIEKAADYKLIEGLPDGTFGHGLQMNRASFVAVLCRMLSWEQAKPAQPSFSDSAASWASGWIESAVSHGALVPGGIFRPNDSITREEMAVMLVRALDYDQLAASLENAPLPFVDVDTNRGYIALAYRFGIINGVNQDGKTYFFPNNASNRETAAAMLVRTYERYTAKVNWLHGFYAFGSYPQISMTAGMDSVSVGWGRMDVDPVSGPYLNQTAASGNEWSIPAQSSLATDYFKQNNTPYHLSVFTSSSDLLTLPDGTKTNDLTAVLATEASRAQAVSAIAAAVGPYAGITIDFEGLREDKKGAFTSFMTDLRTALPADKTLYVCVQTPDWYKGFDYKALGKLCDKVILMAHDYKDRATPVVGSANTNNPVSPFQKVYQALAAITDPDTGVEDKSKIALAIAIDSAGYEIDASGKIAAPTLYSPGVDTLAARLRQSDTVRGWSDVYRNSYLTYTGDGGKTYRVWYEDGRSVTEKVKLAAMFGITGVSLWRVGVLPNDPDPALDYDIWGALQARR